MTIATGSPTPLTPYQRQLFVLLGVATFFEGYEYIALTQLLPSLREAFGLNKSQGGILVGFVGFSALLAFWLIRYADIVGRRRVLSITIAGYTVCSLGCAVAQDAYQFAVAQLLARAFLLGEYAITMVYLAEEFPADRRGFAVGIMQGLNSLGAIVCAGVVPALLKTSLGFRSVYLIGTLPLLLLMVLRRNVRETSRFQALAETERSGDLFAVFRTGYRRRVLLMSAIWCLTYLCTYLGITYWKDFAIQERSFDDAQVSKVIVIAAVGSLPLVFASGKLLDAVGRKRGAVVVFAAVVGSNLLAYNAHGFWWLTLGVTGMIFASSAIFPVLNSFTLELFPTELRADAFGWANNVLGKLGYVVGPLLVGYGGEHIGYGPSLSITSIFPLFALLLILLKLPETRGRELEDTARL